MLLRLTLHPGTFAFFRWWARLKTFYTKLMFIESYLTASSTGSTKRPYPPLSPLPPLLLFLLLRAFSPHTRTHTIFSINNITLNAYKFCTKYGENFLYELWSLSLLLRSFLLFLLSLFYSGGFLYYFFQSIGGRFMRFVWIRKLWRKPEKRTLSNANEISLLASIYSWHPKNIKKLTICECACACGKAHIGRWCGNDFQSSLCVPVLLLIFKTPRQKSQEEKTPMFTSPFHWMLMLFYRVLFCFSSLSLFSPPLLFFSFLYSFSIRTIFPLLSWRRKKLRVFSLSVFFIVQSAWCFFSFLWNSIPCFRRRGCVLRFFCVFRS